MADENAEKGLKEAMAALWSTPQNKAQIRQAMFAKGRKFVIPSNVWNR